MLQDLLSNPGVVSVESLERAQREESRTPPSEMPPMPLQATKADDLEADLKNKLQVDIWLVIQQFQRGGKVTSLTLFVSCYSIKLKSLFN